MSYEEDRKQPDKDAGGPDLTAGQHDRLLRAAEVARLLGVRDKRVYELGIPEVRLSVRSVRWRYKTVMEWIERHAREAA